MAATVGRGNASKRANSVELMPFKRIRPPPLPQLRDVGARHEGLPAGGREDEGADRLVRLERVEGPVQVLDHRRD